MVYFLCKAYDSDRQNCYFALRSPCGERGLKCHKLQNALALSSSLPVRGAWVEISPMLLLASTACSLPVRGAWVEME